MRSRVYQRQKELLHVPQWAILVQPYAVGGFGSLTVRI